MKAAVLYEVGQSPVYADFPSPIPRDEQQILISVKTASIKQLDLLKAAGKHYTQYDHLPTVVGVDGVGVLEGGQRVFSMGLSGMLAEQALVAANRWVVVPDGLDDAVAAALPNALIGADTAMTYRSQLKAGDTVLINGATGTTGRLAVQLAKYHGAAAVIATGRSPAALEQLKSLGADETISLQQPDEAVIKQLQESYRRRPYTIVLDYLWGHPIELIFAALNAVKPQQPVRVVTIGEMAGATASLASGTLRSNTIEVLGSGIGSVTPQQLDEYTQQRLPAMFQLAAEGKLSMDLELIELADVGKAWERAATSSKRLVVRI